MKYIYSVPELLSAYYKNKDVIDAYATGKSKEGYDDKETTILGFSVAFFMTVLLVGLLLWVLAIYLIVKNWDNMSTLCKIFAVVFLFLPHGGPIVSIIIVMLCKSGSSMKSSQSFQPMTSFMHDKYQY